MSKYLRKAKKEISRVAENLTAYDFEPSKMVVVHGINDLGHFVYDCAFVLKFGEWYLVFTEHNGHYPFHEEEYYVVEYVRNYQNITDSEDFEICEKSKEYWESDYGKKSLQRRKKSEN